MKPAEVWDLTPAEIMRYAVATQIVIKERYERDMQLEYTNAYLQRVKKMPPLSKLTGSQKRDRPPTLQEIADRFGLHPDEQERTE